MQLAIYANSWGSSFASIPPRIRYCILLGNHLGYRTAQRLPPPPQFLSSAKRSECVGSGFDKDMQTGISRLRDMGKQVPDDVSVAGFDDHVRVIHVNPLLMPACARATNLHAMTGHSGTKTSRCLIWGEREILVLVGLRGFVVFRFDARDPGERLVQVCHVRADASGQPCGARLGQCFEPVLDVVDATDELGRVHGRERVFDLLALVVGYEAGAARGPVLFVELPEPFPRGARPVIDAAGTSVPGAFARDGFPGRGEQVRLDSHQLP